MTGAERVIRADEDLLTTSVDGDLIGMSIERGICYGFNAVATRAWELLAQPQSLDSLCATLLAEFEVDEATCRSQMAAFLDELAREKLTRAYQGP